ncbi:MAG: RIP metalloprotease RseP [Bacillota bacterium]|nr:RIP metalloprotease RseP [Bacillota bacterium]
MILLYILMVIIGFSFLIIIHELGHFIMARVNGVKVEQFSLGMGPKIFGIKGKETEYLIKALPIGGYIKMLGEEEKVDAKNSFTTKTPLQKLSIVAAGPIMNLIIAVLLFSIFTANVGYQVPVVDKVESGYPAAEELQNGDKIVKVNGSSVISWDDFSTIVYTNKGNNLNIQFIRNGITKSVDIKPKYDDGQKRYIIGITAKYVQNPNVFQSLNHGFIETKSIAVQTFDVFGNIFKGKVSKDDIGGPVTIAKMSVAVAKAGILNFIFFLAYISLQLAIFNLLPIPALDGGWIFFLLIEIITRRKIDDNKMGIINYIGFSLLMALMVLVTIKDIIYPISIPK